MTIRGLEELQSKLNDLSRRVEEISGNQNVPVSELLTPDFLSGCSQYRSADEMFEASGFKIDSPADFEAIPDAEWDEFISRNTSFASWQTMLGEAGKAWVARRLGL